MVGAPIGSVSMDRSRSRPDAEYPHGPATTVGGRLEISRWGASDHGVGHGFATASWEDWLRSSKMLW